MHNKGKKSFLLRSFIFTTPKRGLVKSSSVKCTEHSKEVFPGTQYFLLSRTRFTHWFCLLCLIGHVSPKKTEFDEDYILMKNIFCGIINVVTTSGNAPFRHFQLNGDNSEAKFPLVFKSGKSQPKSRVPEPTSRLTSNRGRLVRKVY